MRDTRAGAMRNVEAMHPAAVVEGLICSNFLF